jgi:hypothetical protein
MSGCTAVPTGGDTCDFCATSSVAKLYRCRNFNVSGMPVFKGTVGTWAACQKCASMVESKRWASLAARAAQHFIHRNRVARHELPNVWVQFTNVCEGFSEHVISED